MYLLNCPKPGDEKPCKIKAAKKLRKRIRKNEEESYSLKKPTKRRYCSYSQFVTSRRGRKLIFLGGYTYSFRQHNSWVCSIKRAKCKARLWLNDKLHIVEINAEHNHLPKTWPVAKNPKRERRRT